jgi:hypothetical protein
MHKTLSVVVPVLVSLFLIQIMSDVLYVRAVGRHYHLNSDKRLRAGAPCRSARR